MLWIKLTLSQPGLVHERFLRKQPKVDAENNILYLCTHPTAFYFTTEVPDTWKFLLTNTKTSVWFVTFCYKLYWFHNSDLTFLNTFITPSTLGLKSSLIWQKYFYLKFQGKRSSCTPTQTLLLQWMKSFSQWRYSTWKILLLFLNFQKQKPHKSNSFLPPHTQGHMASLHTCVHSIC